MNGSEVRTFSCRVRMPYINISGFGNIEPYVPHYYLGLSLKNLDNCKEALQAFDLSEKDGAIQKTNLFKSLQQNRQECMQPR